MAMIEFGLYTFIIFRQDVQSDNLMFILVKFLITETLKL